MIYLDHNATTPIDERVLEAMQPFLSTFYGNPSSLYRLGRIASSAIDAAREQLAALIGVQPGQIIFTSGGTEANNLALATLADQAGLGISAIEHPSIVEPALHLKTLGHQLSVLNVDANGLITQDAIDQVIALKPGLVSIMLANNETGVVQNIDHYADQLSAHGIRIHTDAVQALGKIPLDFNQLGVQLMSLSSHKIYGPKGCGALVSDKTVAIKPMLRGGGQEQGFRAGTENVAAIVGFGKAAELANTELAERHAHLLKLRNLLEQELSAIPGFTVFAQKAERLPNTVQLGIHGIDGEMLLMQLDKKSIAVSSGSACASGLSEPSPVLIAMGIDPITAKSAIRVSLGKANTEAELIEFITHLKSLTGTR
ncbi:MAG: cysteine desulfurase family protein [Methylobacter sp.]|nr:cysteine desulfurase family protein [Methylobacter sp.]MDP2429112.1 cysteine desulfurase family protein [Methylobacter sp.]MDP3055587.1 cysteine desulfurase family protein [Methylobacter sp.]MDP3364304.1 cysteine desulfurase family protein [Methylobacter sp.]MDZ4220732.1 cysteine desulfurase family protein [Methylobacter sp.]